MERYAAVKLWPRCCMLAVVALLGYPQVGAAAGTWPVISLPQKPGEVSGPNALAVDAAGNRFVADSPAPSHLGQNQRRDAPGDRSRIAPPTAPALSVDAAGTLSVSG